VAYRFGRARVKALLAAGGASCKLAGADTLVNEYARLVTNRLLGHINYTVCTLQLVKSNIVAYGFLLNSTKKCKLCFPERYTFTTIGSI
jgi:hypothetical protein